MQTYFRKFSAESLLAIGGVIIFFVFGTWLVLVQIIIAPSSQAMAERTYVLPLELEGKSNFELGQYYFNSDEDPSGPYDLVRAQYYFEKEIAQNPKGNNLAWYQSGRIDFINGDFDKALEKFNSQIVYFADEVPNVYYMIGLTYGYKARLTNNPEDWAQAEDNFLKSIAFFSESPWPRVDLSWVYFSQGKYEQMKIVIEDGFQYEGNNPWLLNMYGLALLNTGDTEMAHEYFIFAAELTEKMDVREWGMSYPGNNPETWEQGLNEFKIILAKNIALTEG